MKRSNVRSRRSSGSKSPEAAQQRRDSDFLGRKPNRNRLPNKDSDSSGSEQYGKSGSKHFYHDKGKPCSPGRLKLRRASMGDVSSGEEHFSDKKTFSSNTKKLSTYTDNSKKPGYSPERSLRGRSKQFRGRGRTRSIRDRSGSSNERDNFSSNQADDGSEMKMEAMYLPPTKGLDERKLKRNLLGGVDLIKLETGVLPIMELDENGKLYFLVKSQSSSMFEKAKSMVIELVQDVLRKMRNETTLSRSDEKNPSSRDRSARDKRRHYRSNSELSLSLSEDEMHRRDHFADKPWRRRRSNSDSSGAQRRSRSRERMQKIGDLYSHRPGLRGRGLRGASVERGRPCGRESGRRRSGERRRDSKERDSPRGSRERSMRRGSREHSLRRGSRERSLRRGSRERSLRRGSRERSLRRGSRERSLRRGSRERSLRRGSRERSLKRDSRDRSMRRGSRDRSMRRGSRERDYSYEVNYGNEFEKYRKRKPFKDAHDDRFYREEKEEYFSGDEHNYGEEFEDYINYRDGVSRGSRPLYRGRGRFFRGRGYLRGREEHFDGKPDREKWSNILDKPMPEISGVAVIQAATMGCLGFVSGLAEGVSIDKLRLAFFDRLGAMQARKLQLVGFISHDASTQLPGIAVIKFSARLQIEVLVEFPEIHLEGSTANVCTWSSLVESSDTALKSRFARLLRSKVHNERKIGIFPQGVQPSRIVLVVDGNVPYLDVDKVKSTSSSVHKVLKDSNLDVVGFYELINDSDCLDGDNTLFVVVPWLSFFLHHVRYTLRTVADTKPFTEEAMERLRKSFNEIAESLNVVGDFCYNPILQSDYDGSADFFSCLDGYCLPKTGYEKSCIALANCIVHSAHSLRCAVLSKTHNSDLVFCGLPVSSFTFDQIKRAYGKKVSPEQVDIACACVLTALRCFNKFASSSWKLGGLQYSNLEFLEEISCQSAAKSITDMDSKINNPSDNESSPSDVDESDQEEGEINKQSSDDEKDSLTRRFKKDHCGIFTISSWRNSSWTSNKKKQSALRTKNSLLSLEYNSSQCTVDEKTKNKMKENLSSDEDNNKRKNKSEKCEKNINSKPVKAESGDEANKPGEGSSRRKFLTNAELKESFTYHLLQSVQSIVRIWKKRVTFVPWTPIETEKFSSGTLPDIVALCVEHNVYKESYNKKLQETQYRCLACDGLSGDLDWAESHAYDRRHMEKIRNTQNLPPDVQGLLLSGGMACDKVYGLKKDYIEKMVEAKLLREVEVSSSSKKKSLAAYECLVCGGGPPLTGVALRVHVCSFEHKASLNNYLGIVNPGPAVSLIENWLAIKRLFRHSSYDAVVLVADVTLASTLRPLRMKNVHIYTISCLVSSEEAQEELLDRWRKDSKQLFANIDDPRVLWIIVTGLDLLLQPKPGNFFENVKPAAVPEETKQEAEPVDDKTVLIKPVRDEVEKKSSVEMKTELLETIKSEVYIDEDGKVHTLQPAAEQENAAPETKAEALDPVTEAKIEAESLKAPANDCCGSVLWDLTLDPSAANYQSGAILDKALNSLNDVRSFLRNRLDMDNTVLLMPVAPLHILLDSVPLATRRALSCLHQTVVLLPDQLLPLQRTYCALFRKTYQLYRTIAEQENVLFDNSNSMMDACVSIVQDADLEAQWQDLSMWHAPARAVIIGALTALPCLYPKPSRLSASELTLVPRSSACAIIGAPKVIPANSYTMQKLFRIPRRLTFNSMDVGFIVNALGARTNFNKSITWTCYLVVPFPDILFTSGILEACKAEGCSNPIIALKRRPDVTVQRLMDRITSFMSLLSYSLGSGNFVTLYPVHPSALVCFDRVDEENHAILHTVVMRNPQAMLCNESYGDVVKPALDKLNFGLTEIFNKSKLCCSLQEEDNERFAFTKPTHLMRHGDTIVGSSEVKEWLTLVNNILQSNHRPMAVKGEVMQMNAGGGIFNPFTWSSENYSAGPVDPNADPSMFMGAQPYNNLGFNYDGEQGDFSAASQGRGRGFVPNRGFRGRQPIGNFRSGSRFPPQPSNVNTQVLVPPPGAAGAPATTGQSSVRPPAQTPSSDLITYPGLPSDSCVPATGDVVETAEKKDKKRDILNTVSGIFNAGDNVSEGSSRSSDSGSKSDASRSSGVRSRSKYRHSKGKERRPSRKKRKGVESSSEDDHESRSSKRKRRSSRKSKHRRRSRKHDTSSSSSGSASSSEELVSRKMSSKRHKTDESRASRLAKDAASTLLAEAEMRGSCAVSAALQTEVISQLAATEAAAALPGGASRFCLRMNSRLSEVTVRSLIKYFQMQPEPCISDDGSWLVRSNNSSVVSFLLKKLGSCRLFDARLSAALDQSHGKPVAGSSETEAVYARILEQFVNEYNASMVTKLVIDVIVDDDCSFFGHDWQHVYTRGLKNTLVVAANATRSLGKRLSRHGPSSPRILIVTPDDSVARCLILMLKPVAKNSMTDILHVNGETRFNTSCEVVIGALHYLSEVQNHLQFNGLKALIVDEVDYLVKSPLHSILLSQLVSHLRKAVENYDAVNKVAVATGIDLKELSKAESMLKCRFIRMDLKQHIAMPDADSNANDVSYSDQQEYEEEHRYPMNEYSQPSYPEANKSCAPKYSDEAFPPPAYGGAMDSSPLYASGTEHRTMASPIKTVPPAAFQPMPYGAPITSAPPPSTPFIMTRPPPAPCMPPPPPPQITSFTSAPPPFPRDNRYGHPPQLGPRTPEQLSTPSVQRYGSTLDPISRTSQSVDSQQFVGPDTRMHGTARPFGSLDSSSQYRNLNLPPQPQGGGEHNYGSFRSTDGAPSKQAPSFRPQDYQGPSLSSKPPPIERFGHRPEVPSYTEDYDRGSFRVPSGSSQNIPFIDRSQEIGPPSAGLGLGARLRMGTPPFMGRGGPVMGRGVLQFPSDKGGYF